MPGSTREGLGFAPVPVYLVRHAHAGSRSAWHGDDLERPLSDKGRRQVEGLCRALAGVPVAEVASSSYRRCIETVQPLAEVRGLEVRTTPVLAEGAGAQAAIEWLLARAEAGVIACSHGDLIPKVLRRLLADGMGADEGAISQKGSVWVLDAEGGRFVRGHYLPPVAAPTS